MGMLIDVDTYKAESAQIKTLKNLAAGKQEEIQQNRNTILLKNKRIKEDSVDIATRIQQLKSCQEAKETAATAFVDVQKEIVKQRPKWFEKPIVWGPVGFTAGVYVGAKLISKIKK